MIPKPTKSLNKWLAYLLISIPMAIALHFVILYKLQPIFWTYMAVMGISALITRWNTGNQNKSKWVWAMEHICMVCAITLFIWGGWAYFFYPK